MSQNELISRFVLALMIFLVSMSASAFSEEDTNDRSIKPIDGQLLLPDDYNKAEEKKCMTICKEWGENCILRQKGSGLSGGAYERKCRRVCKSFGEECF